MNKCIYNSSKKKLCEYACQKNLYSKTLLKYKYLAYIHLSGSRRHDRMGSRHTGWSAGRSPCPGSPRGNCTSSRLCRLSSCRSCTDWRGSSRPGRRSPRPTSRWSTDTCMCQRCRWSSCQTCMVAWHIGPPGPGTF